MAIDNILCIDDELSWRRTLQMNFEDALTINVDLAKDYKSGLEKISNKYYDLIVLDGLEGDCFRIHEDIKNIPHGEIIIFSGDVRIGAEAKRRGIPIYDKGELNKILAQYAPATD